MTRLRSGSSIGGLIWSIKLPELSDIVPTPSSPVSVGFTPDEVSASVETDAEAMIDEAS